MGEPAGAVLLNIPFFSAQAFSAPSHLVPSPAEQWLDRLRQLGKLTKVFIATASQILARPDLTADEGHRVWEMFQYLADQAIALRGEMNAGRANVAFLAAGETLEKILLDFRLVIVTRLFELSDDAMVLERPLLAA